MDMLILSVKEAATALAVSRTVLYELMDADLIPYHHIGRKRVITCQALEDFSHFFYKNGSIGPVEVDYD
jgi:excisionase family DNA binding protein